MVSGVIVKAKTGIQLSSKCGALGQDQCLKYTSLRLRRRALSGLSLLCAEGQKVRQRGI